MNAETTTQPGVISASIEADLSLPPSLDGLLHLSQAFERAGYAKLARYLRGCGDALCNRLPMQALPATPVAPFGGNQPCVLLAHSYDFVYDAGDASQKLVVRLSGTTDDVQAVRLGERYMLVPAPRIPARLDLPGAALPSDEAGLPMLPGMRDGSECRCECHRDRNVRHVAPCCYPALGAAAMDGFEASIPAGDPWKG